MINCCNMMMYMCVNISSGVYIMNIPYRREKWNETLCTVCVCVCVYKFTRLGYFVFMYLNTRGNVPLKSAWDEERRKKHILFTAVSLRSADLHRHIVGGYIFNMYTSHAHVSMYRTYIRMCAWTADCNIILI